jgi:hypothetical protein
MAGKKRERENEIMANILVSMKKPRRSPRFLMK